LSGSKTFGGFSAIVPGFGKVRSGLFRDESTTLPMLLGRAVTLTGTALATGFPPRGSHTELLKK
jgi:hypothetical protein